jgi:hypothetical protein
MDWCNDSLPQAYLTLFKHLTINQQMPAHRAKNNSKKEVNKAVSANMHELSKDKKGRSQKQLVAIAFSEAQSKNKIK